MAAEERQPWPATVPVVAAGGERPDAELVEAARSGSRPAIEQLVERHWEQSHRIAFAILGDTHLAEDATQEAMVSALEHLGRFDARRSFGAWLHRIVANRALDAGRARRRREDLPRQIAPPAATSGEDPRLVEALLALPIEQRAVVVLRHVAGYGTDEIARMLRLRRGTVGSRLRRGLDRMRAEMEAEDG